MLLLCVSVVHPLWKLGGAAVSGEVWKNDDVATRFLTERSAVIPDRARQLEVLLRLLRSASPQPRRILDLGAGDALLLATTLEAFPEVIGLALDFSPPMRDQTRGRLAVFGKRATVVEADLTTPDWRRSVSGPFDAVVSGFAIHHLTHDRKRVLYAEIFDLLSPGGTFVNCEHVASPSARIESLFNDAMSEHLWQRRRDAGEAATVEQVRHEYVTRQDQTSNILAPVEEQCAWLRHIGFRDVDCFWKYFELAVFGGTR